MPEAANLAVECQIIMSLPRMHVSALEETDAGDLVDLGAFFGSLWRGRWVILVSVALSVLAAGIYVLAIATPLYRATAVVILDTRKQQVIDLPSVMGGLSADTPVVNSEVEVLRSRALMRQVAGALHLVRDPEFNPELRKANGFERIMNGLRRWLGLSRPRFPEPRAQRALNATIHALVEKTSVRNVPRSLVFQITAETTTPAKSVLIADTIARLYIRNQLEAKYSAARRATKWLTGRVGELQSKLAIAERKVKDFNARTDLIDQTTLRAQERQLKQLRDRILEAENIASQMRATLHALHSAPGRRAQAALSGDDRLNALLERVRGNDAPAAAAAFDARFSRIVKQAEEASARAESRLRVLRKSQSGMQARIDRQSHDLMTLQQLTREADASRALYRYFLGRLNETSAQRGIQEADSHVLSGAVLPQAPSSPRKTLIMALAALLGLIVGAGLVSGREASARTFRTAADLEKVTGRPVMGQIPLLPQKKYPAFLKYLAARPASIAAEAMRNLRTTVLLSNVDKPPQVIVVSSALPGEGKTSMALALAQNLDALGKSVLLIEGDIRTRALSRYLGAEDAKGILAAVSGAASLSECILHHDTVGADILVGEPSSLNAADLFSSNRFAEFLKQARTTHDVIIIDTSPVLVVPDARVIGQLADAILCVVKWDTASRAQIEEARRMFATVNLKITGFVLNQIDMRRMKRYGHTGKFGAYAGYNNEYYVN